jgi:predicted O-methyltransferase YrrM
MGVDLDPSRVKDAKENAKKAGVDDKVEFKQQDLFDTDISKATVLTMYLLPKVNMKLRPRILSELKPGTRVVSHSFDMGDWKPERTEKVDGRTIYFWTVPKPGQRAQASQ